MNKSFFSAFLLFLTLAATMVATNEPAMQTTVESAGAASRPSANASLAQLLVDKEKSLPEAEKRKDLDFFKNITTEDFLEVAPDAKVYSKEEMLEGLNAVDLQNYSIYDARVLPLNDNAAVVTYDAIVQMTIGDEHAPRYQHVSSVWVNQGGNWLLKFQQATAAQ